MCPADRGFGSIVQPSTAGTSGNSYRLNWDIEGDYYYTSGVAEAPEYNLGLKKESWVPEPARFIEFYDAAVYPFDMGGGEFNVTQWHNTANPGNVWDAKTIKSDPERLVGTVGAVDGHAQLCDFSPTMKPNLARGLEPGKDFMWYKPAAR